MSKTKTGLLLLSILIVATFLRLYHIKTTPPGLYPDEAVNALNAVTANTTGDYKVYYPDNNGREGLFMNIQAMSLKFFGVNEPWSLRFPAAIFGILTVLGIFLLGHELFNRRIGLLAAFFAATSFWHINFSRIGFRAIMAPFFLTFAMYFLLKAIRRSHGGGMLKWGACIAAIGGVFFGLGFYSYISYRVAPLLLVLFVWFFRKEKDFWKVLFVFLGFTFIVALPIGLYYLHHPQDFMGRTSQVSIFSSENPVQMLAVNVVKTVGMFFVYGDANWRHNYAGMPQLFVPVALMFAYGLFLTVRGLWQKHHGEHTTDHMHRFAPWFLAAWLALTALPAITSSEGIPHALRVIVMVPPVMIVAAWGGIMFYDAVRKRYKGGWVNPVFALILIVIALQAYYLYFEDWAKKPDVQSAFAADYTAMAHEIREVAKNAPVYVVGDGGGIDARIINPFDGSARTVGFPLATQVIMFITDTFSPETQLTHQIYYFTPDQAKQIPIGAKRYWVR